MISVFALTKIRIKLVLQNRSAAFMNIVFDLLSLMLPYLMWSEVLKSVSGSPYNQQTILAYYLSYFFSQSLSTWSHALEFGVRVERGTLKFDLLKPMSSFEILWGSWVGSVVTKFFLSVIPVAIFAFLFGSIKFIHFNFVSIFTLLISSLVYASLGFVLALISFQVRELHVLNHLMRALTLFLGGGLAPLELLFTDRWMLLRHLPFSYGGYWTAKLLSVPDSVSWKMIYSIWIIGVFWIIAFLLLFRTLINLQLKSYEASGG